MLQFSLNLYFVFDLKLDYNFIQSSQSRLQTPLFSSNSAGRHNSMNPRRALSSWSVDHGHSIPKSDHSSHHPCQILHSSGFWMFYVTNYPWENVSLYSSIFSQTFSLSYLWILSYSHLQLLLPHFSTTDLSDKIPDSTFTHLPVVPEKISTLWPMFQRRYIESFLADHRNNQSELESDYWRTLIISIYRAEV